LPVPRALRIIESQLGLDLRFVEVGLGHHDAEELVAKLSIEEVKRVEDSLNRGVWLRRARW
jgi:hypothetical protein